MTLNVVHHNDHAAVDPNLYSPRRRGAKALVCLLLAATVPPCCGPAARHGLARRRGERQADF